MAALGPGVLVRCVAAFSGLTYNEAAPVVGGIYTVRTAAPGMDGSGDIFIRLEEIVNPPMNYREGCVECEWIAEKFALINSSALDVFRQATTDIPEKVEA